MNSIILRQVGRRQLCLNSAAGYLLPCRHILLRRNSTIATSSTESSVDARGPRKPWSPESFSDNPRLFTLTTSSPSTLTKNDVLKSVEQVVWRTPKRRFEYEGLARNVVILATPPFACWIQDADFIGKILDKVSVRAHRSDRTKTVTAVVDGLSPCLSRKEIASSRNTSPTSEGFSFMISPIPKLLGEGGDQVAGFADAAKSQSGLIFNFMTSPGKSLKQLAAPGAMAEVTVPLANTIFRNGRASTLMVGEWSNTNTPVVRRVGTPLAGGRRYFTPKSLAYQESCTIHSEPFRLPRDRVSVPLDDLTEPKRIVAGLGNIVRQLEGSDGAAVPASTELEERVVSYLSSKNLPQQTVSVWALVVPEGAAAPVEAHTLPIFAKIQDLGAGLHRVLSGGGGWGKKAGLLSLDPVTIAPGSDSEYDFSSFQSDRGGINEQTEALGDIAKPGSTVQFFISTQGLEGLTQTQKRMALPVEPRIRLGCVQSTIDDLPVVSAESTGEEAKLRIRFDDFTAQSELGLFVRIKSAVEDDQGNKSWSVVNATKVDIPGTSMHAAYQAFEKPGNDHVETL